MLQNAENELDVLEEMKRILDPAFRPDDGGVNQLLCRRVGKILWVEGDPLKGELGQRALGLR